MSVTYATHAFAPVKIGASWYGIVTFADPTNPLVAKPDNTTLTIKVCRGGIKRVLTEGDGLTVTFADGLVTVLMELLPADTTAMKVGTFDMLLEMSWDNPVRVVYPLEAVFTIEEKF